MRPLGCGLCVVVLLGSCAPVRVPVEQQGTELLVIENRYSASLCTLFMTPDRSPMSRNWLRRRLRPGKRVEVRVKAGTYRVSGSGCDEDFSVGGDLVVAGPSALGFGTAPDPVAGRTSQMITVYPRSKYRGGSRTLAPAPAPVEERSCTGICGGPQGQFGSCCPDEGWHCVIDPKDRSDPSASGVCSLQ